jgi:ribonuclease E
MTRKRVGEGLLEAFSETCPHCNGRGVIVHPEPVDKAPAASSDDDERPKARRKRSGAAKKAEPAEPMATPEQRRAALAAMEAIHRAAHHEDDEVSAEDLEQIDEQVSEAVALAAAIEDAPIEETPLDGEPTAPEVAATDEAATADPVSEQLPADEDAGVATPLASAPVTAAPSARRRRVASRPAGPPQAAAGE